MSVHCIFNCEKAGGKCISSATVSTLAVAVPSLVKGGGRHWSSLLWHSVVKHQHNALATHLLQMVIKLW